MTELIKTLQKLEPKFIEAGKLALKLQKGIKPLKKSNTGNIFADIVTKADYEVQEFLLKELEKSELKHCRILAEEETPTTKKFNPNGKIFLSVDPIDGTQRYARHLPFFSVIIGLQDGKGLLYTFKYFPSLNWIHRIIKDTYRVKGQKPKITPLLNTEKTIGFKSGNPANDIPDLSKKLARQGYIFGHQYDIAKDTGLATLFLAGKIPGLYIERPNVYDAFVGLHFAQAKNYKIFTSKNFSISKIKRDQYGDYYPGWYLALHAH